MWFIDLPADAADTSAAFGKNSYTKTYSASYSIFDTGYNPAFQKGVTSSSVTRVHDGTSGYEVTYYAATINGGANKSGYTSIRAWTDDRQTSYSYTSFDDYTTGTDPHSTEYNGVATRNYPTVVKTGPDESDTVNSTTTDHTISGNTTSTRVYGGQFGTHPGRQTTTTDTYLISSFLVPTAFYDDTGGSTSYLRVETTEYQTTTLTWTWSDNAQICDTTYALTLPNALNSAKRGAVIFDTEGGEVGWMLSVFTISNIADLLDLGGLIHVSAGASLMNSSANLKGVSYGSSSSTEMGSRKKYTYFKPASVYATSTITYTMFVTAMTMSTRIAESATVYEAGVYGPAFLPASTEAYENYFLSTSTSTSTQQGVSTWSYISDTQFGVNTYEITLTENLLSTTTYAGLSYDNKGRVIGTQAHTRFANKLSTYYSQGVNFGPDVYDNVPQTYFTETHITHNSTDNGGAEGGGTTDYAIGYSYTYANYARARGFALIRPSGATVLQAGFSEGFALGAGEKCDVISINGNQTYYYPFFKQVWPRMWAPMTYVDGIVLAYPQYGDQTSYSYNWAKTGSVVTIARAWQGSSDSTVVTLGSAAQNNDSYYETTAYDGAFFGKFVVGGKQWKNNQAQVILAKGMWELTLNDEFGNSQSSVLTLNEMMVYSVPLNMEAVFHPIWALTRNGSLLNTLGYFNDSDRIFAIKNPAWADL